MAGTANSIITPQTPNSNHVTQSFTATTNVSTTTPTNTVLLVTAGANGGRLTKLRAVPAATVAVTQMQEFRSNDSGATKNLSNVALGASGGYTFAPGTLPPVADFGYSDDNPKILKAGEQIYVGAAVTGTWSFEVEWADY